MSSAAQIRDDRDFLTRHYREIGIGAVAASAGFTGPHNTSQPQMEASIPQGITPPGQEESGQTSFTVKDVLEPLADGSKPRRHAQQG